MDGHQTEYMEALTHILPTLHEEVLKELLLDIEVSFSEGEDFRHHVFVKLVERGYMQEAVAAKNTPLYDISFDEPEEYKMLTEWHDPERYLLVRNLSLEEVVNDEAEDIIDGGWVDNGIGPYEYGGCPGYHTQVDYEYSINEVEVDWFENFDHLLSDKELAEHLSNVEYEGASVRINEGDETVALTVTNVKATSITLVTLNYSGKVDGEWQITATREMYKYWFSATVGE